MAKVSQTSALTPPASDSAAAVRKQGAHPKARLVPEEDLDAAWLSYQETIWVPPITPLSAERRNDPRAGDELGDSPPVGLNVFTVDAGVEQWSKLSPEELKGLLGIPSTGLPDAAVGLEGRPGIGPSWHQCDSIVEMVYRTFNSDGDITTPTT